MKDPLALAFIDAYISVFVEAWNCRLDHEDASHAPFGALASQEADALADEMETVVAVMSE